MEAFSYSNLTFDMKVGSGKGWGKYLEAARDTAKSVPRRPLEEVLNAKFTQIDEIKVAVVTVTPVMAWELLIKHNVRNRPIAYVHAVRLATEILAGNWMVTHQGGAFNARGDIEDVQHRLVAVILANQPIRMMMVADLSDDLFKTIDIGKTRSAGSALELAGHNGESALLSHVITDLAIAYDEQTLLFFRNKSSIKKRQIGRTELIEFAHDNPSLITATHDALDLHGTALAAISDEVVGVFAYWKIREAWGADVADSFMELIADDTHPDKHPVGMLINRINKHKLAKRAGKDDVAKKNILKRDQIAWLVAAAFRALRKGSRNVRLDPRGDDSFPRFEDSAAPALQAPDAEAA